MSCVEKCKELNTSCPNTGCRHCLDYEEDLNCTIVCVQKNGCLTLREVAERLKVSYVRIKQIQDKALQKINKNISLKQYLLMGGNNS